MAAARARASGARAITRAFSYYEKWMAGLADLLVAQRRARRRETNWQRGDAAGQSDLADRALPARCSAPTGRWSKGGPTERPTNDAPRLRARRRCAHAPPTRAIGSLPAAIRDCPATPPVREGRILRCHGAHVLPDANAHGWASRPSRSTPWPSRRGTCGTRPSIRATRSCWISGKATSSPHDTRAGLSRAPGMRRSSR